MSHGVLLMSGNCCCCTGLAGAGVSKGRTGQRDHVTSEADGLARRGCLTVELESQARCRAIDLLLPVQVGLESLK